MTQKGLLPATHPAGLVRLLVIVPQEVENAVDYQPGDFPPKRVALRPGLPEGGRDRNDDVAQKTGRASFQVAGILQRKRQNVGGLILAAVDPVEGLNPAVADERQADLGVRPPQPVKNLFGQRFVGFGPQGNAALPVRDPNRHIPMLHNPAAPCRGTRCADGIARSGL